MMFESKKKVCANCRQTYIEGDKYCRYCGAPMGTPIFIDEVFECVYGPEPMKRYHICAKCGYSWETNLMTDLERFCPKCRGKAPGKDDREPSTWDFFRKR